MMPNSEPAIVVEGAVKTFSNGFRALDGIDISIPSGELVALVGANGSGKSTLLKILFGIIQADAGTVRVLGLDPRRDRFALSTQVGYGGQDVALDTELTGRETLRLFYALRGLPQARRRERIERLVQEYDLGSFYDRAVWTYSGGQRQRLHLALETMHNPSLLMLDEPTTSLDPEGRRTLWGSLAAMRDEGHTIVVSTHDLSDAAFRCDRVLLLRAGRLLASDSPENLVAIHGKARAVITLERPVWDDIDNLQRDLSALPGSPEVVIDRRTITIWRDHHPEGAEHALEVLSAYGIPYQRYERLEPDLAEVYFRLTGSSLEGEPQPPRRQRGGGGGGGGGNRRR